MQIEKTHNTNISSISHLPSAAELKNEFPLTELSWATVLSGRTVIPKILLGEDPRLLVTVGPCSIHDLEANIEYASRLQDLSTKCKKELFIVMRAVPSKPRSRAQSNGRASWQGLINDPKLDSSFDMELGFKQARKLMLQITAHGLPIATEMLDKFEWQAVDDLLSLIWLGARDSNSQDKKKFASGASTAVGFKNPTEGKIDTAIHAIEFAKHAQVFPAPDDAGLMCRYATKGNPFGFLIHRGFEKQTNFDRESIEESSRKLEKLGLIHRVVVDAAHGNSQKNHMNQRGVLMEVVRQIREGCTRIAGVMYESFLEDGHQPIPVDLRTLRRGLSITDPCDGWKRTEETILMLAQEYGQVLKD